MNNKKRFALIVSTVLLAGCLAGCSTSASSQGDSTSSSGTPNDTSSMTATEGDPLSAEELENMTEEYAKFGVAYDAKENQWYFNGEKVRFFQDILASNGEDLTNGKFSGTIRTFTSESGAIDIYTVRDFEVLDASGYGTLTGIEVQR